ncbi:MAG: hypothetical protein OWT28_05015 [Firmicutes bacterium]|nr:hypothetical protein [Bacillota bacterium]
MFFRRRNHSFLLRVILIIFGVKWFSNRGRRTEQESCHKASRTRVRAFRSKLREAAAVWDDPAYDEPGQTSEAAD